MFISMKDLNEDTLYLVPQSVIAVIPFMNRDNSKSCRLYLSNGMSLVVLGSPEEIRDRLSRSSW